MLCAKSFQSTKRENRLTNKLWHKYVWQRQTVNDLAKDYQRSRKWIGWQLNKARITRRLINPQPVVVVADTTFWGRYYGVAIFREPNLKKNLWWQEVSQETPTVYSYIRYQLEKRGFTIKGAVIDGKKGVKEVFFGIPVQYCQFHQLKTNTRYLTTRPKLKAGQELRRVALTLTQTTKNKFKKDLDSWHQKYSGFLKEKTLNFGTNRYFFTHRKLRSAYRSLTNNLPYLFTYQKHHELNIPNTTNSLEGSFNTLKSRLRVHQGMNERNRYKMICEILNK